MEVQIITPPAADETHPLDHGLLTLTEAICQATGEESGFGLGGRFGYCENYENDVFVMRRYYWGDCDCGYHDREADYSSKHFHKPDCYYSEMHREKKAVGLSYIDTEKNKFVPVDDSLSYDQRRSVENAIYERLLAKFGLPEEGSACHCTCGHDAEWNAWVAVNGHTPACSVILPNFRHKSTGFEVRWYKWIGRDNEVANAEGVDLQAVFSECVASLRSNGQGTIATKETK